MVTEKTIKQLLDRNGDTKITITMPTYKVGAERQQNPIRFKNLLSKVDDELTALGFKENDRKKILKPANEILEQSLFWSGMEHGMTVYLTRDYFEVFRLPYELEEMVYIQDHFLVTPLLPMISSSGSFNILAVSLKNTRLLRCTRTSVTDITPKEVPGDINDWMDEKPEQQLQFHTGNNEGEKAVFFGHGNAGEDHKEIVEEYLRDVEKALRPTLKNQADPLLLAGVERNLGLFRKIVNHNRLMEQEIDRNPDDLSDTQLRDQGWSIVREYFLSNLYQSLEEYEKSNSELISTDPSEIIPSTITGKTGAIFIAKNAIRWGKYDDKNHKVLYQNQRDGDAVELMNWLSMKGLETGSSVYVLPKEEMPVQSEVAALFRY